MSVDTCDYPTLQHDRRGRNQDPPAFCWPIPVALLLAFLTVGVASLGGVAAAILSAMSLTRHWSAETTAVVAGAILVLAYLVIAAALAGAARNSGTSVWMAVGMHKAPLLQTISVGLAVGLGMRFATALYGIVMQQFQPSVRGTGDPTKLLPSNPAGIALTVFVACVLAPIVEEMVFRGALLTALARRLGAFGGLVISSVLFAAAHASLYAALPIFVLALILGRMFMRTGTLWQPIAIHAAFNTIGILAVYGLKAMGLV